MTASELPVYVLNLGLTRRWWGRKSGELLLRNVYASQATQAFFGFHPVTKRYDVAPLPKPRGAAQLRPAPASQRSSGPAASSSSVARSMPAPPPPRSGAAAPPQSQAADATRPKKIMAVRPKTMPTPLITTAADQQPESAAAHQPEATAAQQPKAAVAEQPEAAAAEQPEAAAARQPETAADQQPKAAAAAVAAATPAPPSPLPRAVGAARSHAPLGGGADARSQEALAVKYLCGSPNCSYSCQGNNVLLGYCCRGCENSSGQRHDRHCAREEAPLGVPTVRAGCMDAIVREVTVRPAAEGSDRAVRFSDASPTIIEIESVEDSRRRIASTTAALTQATATLAAIQQATRETTPTLEAKSEEATPQAGATPPVAGAAAANDAAAASAGVKAKDSAAQVANLKRRWAAAVSAKSSSAADSAPSALASSAAATGAAASAAAVGGAASSEAGLATAAGAAADLKRDAPQAEEGKGAKLPRTATSADAQQADADDRQEAMKEEEFNRIVAPVLRERNADNFSFLGSPPRQEPRSYVAVSVVDLDSAESVKAFEENAACVAILSQTCHSNAFGWLVLLVGGGDAPDLLPTCAAKVAHLNDFAMLYATPPFVTVSNTKGAILANTAVRLGAASGYDWVELFGPGCLLEKRPNHLTDVLRWMEYWNEPMLLQTRCSASWPFSHGTWARAWMEVGGYEEGFATDLDEEAWARLLAADHSLHVVWILDAKCGYRAAAAAPQTWELAFKDKLLREQTRRNNDRSSRIGLPWRRIFEDGTASLEEQRAAVWLIDEIVPLAAYSAATAYVSELTHRTNPMRRFYEAEHRQTVADGGLLRSLGKGGNRLDAGRRGGRGRGAPLRTALPRGVMRVVRKRVKMKEWGQRRAFFGITEDGMLLS